jgi:hypothetical protein
MIRFSHPFVLLILLGLLGIFLIFREDRKSLLLRLLTASLVIVALAGPQLGRQTPEQNVYFLVDCSPSVTRTATEEAVEDQLEAIISGNPGRRFGAISFAEHATITAPIDRDEPVIRREPNLGIGTNLGVVVDLALATLPREGTSQLVVVSDGRITEGLTKAISASQQAGIPVSTLPIGAVAKDDVALDQLNLPSEVEVNRPFAIELRVSTEEEGEGSLVIYRDGELLTAEEIAFPAGTAHFKIADTLTAAGAHTYQAIIRRPGDPFPENDALSAVVRTAEQPQLLVVCAGESEPVARLLSGAGKSFATTTTLPSLEELSEYRQVLLTGTPLKNLLPQEIETLGTFVSDLGGGLVVAEGEDALRGFSGGGIERMLPISYTLPQKGREASLCVVFVLDHSASMRGSAGGVPKIEALKEAAAASIGLLGEETLVGVIVFNRTFEWLVPIQPLGDGANIYERLRALSADGGTDIYYPIVDALDKLEEVEARTKHILLLSDGKTADEYRDFPSLFSRLENQEEIALSAVAIGPLPNLPLLSRLVEEGHGMLYTATEFSSLPQISMQATQRLSRSRFITGEIAVNGSLSHGDLTVLPALNGYTLTYPKPTAEVLLWAGKDPLLARWRFGLGRVSVLNTDLEGRWSSNWLAWDKGALLLDAILASAESVLTLSPGLILSTEQTDDDLIVLADARDARGEFANFLDVDAALLPGTKTLPMIQVAPGFYRAVFDLPEEGGYALKVIDHTRNKSAVLPLCVPYSSEYRQTGVDKETLEKIARETGGRFLEDEILPDLRPENTPLIYTDIHPSFLLAALSLFMIELGIRKLPQRRRAA